MGTKKQPIYGQVVFYEIVQNPKGLNEIGRSRVLPFSDAIEVYANVPNPASQLLEFDTQDEYEAADAELSKNINNPKWLKELFNCI